MTGVCVVGAGFWACEMHLPALRQIPGVRLVGVVSASAESAKTAAEAFGVPRWYDDLTAALADPEVDVVDIVAPPDVHAPAAIAAAAAGKHVICIKPLARDSAEAATMLDAARAAGTRLLYAENVPFIPAVRSMMDVIEAGEIGDVFRVKACEGIGEPHSPWFFDPARSGGGAILDMAVHSIAFCRFLAGSPVTGVFAEAGTYVWGDRTTAEDTAVLTLRFANGAIGQCEDSWSLAGAMDSRFEVYGTRGRILVDNLHRQPLQVVSGDRGWSYPLPIPGVVADGHLAMLTHFIECLRTGAPSMSEGDAGLEVLRVVDAARRSVRTGIREGVSA